RFPRVAVAYNAHVSNFLRVIDFHDSPRRSRAWWRRDRIFSIIRVRFMRLDGREDSGERKRVRGASENRFASCGKPDASTWLVASSMMNRCNRPRQSLQWDIDLLGNPTVIATDCIPCRGNGMARRGKNFSHFQRYLNERNGNLLFMSDLREECK